ncbi:MAG: hypothetical protein KKD07_06080 [Candidatus Omnitrophica bacterium]|nr:hypothetical protein [Candidatus Omnitrophota bacterium]
MAKLNIKKIFIGLVLMIFALLCAVTAFYILEVKPKMEARKKTGTVKAAGLPKLVDKKIKEEPKKAVKKNVESRIKDRMSKISDKIKKKLPEQESKEVLKKEPAKEQPQEVKSVEKTISVKALVRESEAVYDDAEKARREGLLWVDRKTERIMVTLGAVHGLSKGSKLSVYEGSAKIGQVKVDTAFDVISFVSPGGNALDLSKHNYYKIVVE